MEAASGQAAHSGPPPPVQTKPSSRRRTVGFEPSDTSPSSVLGARRGEGDSPSSARAEVLESPSALAAALRRDRSLPTLNLPKLKLGVAGKKALPRSKSQGQLWSAAAVPKAAETKSATSSPQAASSAGSEPLSRPFK